MRSAKEINDLFKTLKYRIYANRTNDGTREGCKQAMDDSIRIEKIAEDFAIGFAEWICQKAEITYIKGKMDSTLEIYKKEKGL